MIKKNNKNNKGGLAHNRVKDNSGSKRSLYQNYQNGAKSRGLEFSLTFEEFVDLTGKDCSYCGALPQNKYPSRQAKGQDNPLKYYYYNGLDRVDPKLGYILDNVQPCCADCNYAKSDLTEEEFLILVEKIYKNRIQKIIS
jgi:hypothetical protein